jgi:hypothetical protein
MSASLKVKTELNQQAVANQMGHSFVKASFSITQTET